MNPGYTLKKSLGQHFLQDEALCQRIVEQVDRRPGMKLLEVGPGGGAITKYLLEWKDIDYKAIEIDREKIAYLNTAYPAIHDRIIEADILDADRPFDGPFTLIGNFPYNISTQILFKVMEWKDQVEEVVGMFQKEVAVRIANGPGSREYGILSVLMQAFYKVEYLFDVPASAFNPPPKVMSGVLKCTRNGNPYDIQDLKIFTRLVKAAFNQRRKTLRNALRGTLTEQALTENEWMGKRAEQLSVAQFASLYHQYMLKP